MIQMSLRFKFTMKNVDWVLKIALFPTLSPILCVERDCFVTQMLEVANAVGAALPLVSITFDHFVPFKKHNP